MRLNSSPQFLGAKIKANALELQAANVLVGAARFVGRLSQALDSGVEYNEALYEKLSRKIQALMKQNQAAQKKIVFTEEEFSLLEMLGKGLRKGLMAVLAQIGGAIFGFVMSGIKLIGTFFIRAMVGLVVRALSIASRGLFLVVRGVVSLVVANPVMAAIGGVMLAAYVGYKVYKDSKGEIRFEGGEVEDEGGGDVPSKPNLQLPTSSQKSVPLNATLAERVVFARQFFIDKNWSPSQAAGIVGNLMQESMLDPGANNGTHYGIAQWDKTRRAEFEAVFKKPIRGSTLAEQLEFVNYELTEGTHKHVGKEIKATKTILEASDIVGHSYEVPVTKKNWHTTEAGRTESAKRARWAEQAATQELPTVNPKQAAKPTPDTAQEVKPLALPPPVLVGGATEGPPPSPLVPKTGKRQFVNKNGKLIEIGE